MIAVVAAPCPSLSPQSGTGKEDLGEVGIKQKPGPLAETGLAAWNGAGITQVNPKSD